MAHNPPGFDGTVPPKLSLALPPGRCNGAVGLQMEDPSGDRGNEKLTGLFEAADAKGQVRMARHAKESVRELYTHTDAEVASAFVDELLAHLADKDMPIEVRSLDQTIRGVFGHL